MSRAETEHRSALTRNNLLKQRETLIEYLTMKTETEDWHGCEMQQWT